MIFLVVHLLVRDEEHLRSMNCTCGPSVKVVVTSDTGGDLQRVFGDGSEGGVKDAHWEAQIEVFGLYLPFVNKDCFISLR